jgi:hypothetical protein
MRYGVFAAAGAVLLLSGCGSANEAETADGAAAEAAAPAEAPAAAEAAAAPAGPAVAGAKPTKDFMVGKWGEDGDCVMAIDFKADGTTDGPFGDWNLDDGVLTMGDAPQKVHLTIVDDKTIDSKLDGKGPSKKMTRC